MIINKIGYLVLKATSSQEIRYLLAGLWNTAFGYLCAVTIYYFLGDDIGVVGVGIVSNIISISMSFFVYKICVFRVRGGWVREYLRAYLVYGTSFLMAIPILYLGVDILGLAFWLVQGVVIIATIIISYIGHKKFTFKK